MLKFEHPIISLIIVSILYAAAWLNFIHALNKPIIFNRTCPALRYRSPGKKNEEGSIASGTVIETAYEFHPEAMNAFGFRIPAIRLSWRRT